MKDLSKLIERITGSLNKDSATKAAVRECIEEKTRVKLGDKSIFIKDGVLEISASGGAKSEVRLKEGEILSDLAGKGIHISRILYK